MTKPARPLVDSDPGRGCPERHRQVGQPDGSGYRRGHPDHQRRRRKPLAFCPQTRARGGFKNLWTVPGSLPVTEMRLIAAAEQALYASKITSYAQGLSLLKMASPEYNWGLGSLSNRSGLAGRLHHPRRYAERHHPGLPPQPDLPNLLLDKVFAQAILSRQAAWRQVVQNSGRAGHPHAGDRRLTGLFRCLPLEKSACQPDPGAARLLWRPYIPAHGPRRRLPHPVGSIICLCHVFSCLCCLRDKLVAES